MSNIIQQIREAYAENPKTALKLLPELFSAVDKRVIIELPCKMGAEAYRVMKGQKVIVKGAITEYSIGESAEEFSFVDPSDPTGGACCGLYDVGCLDKFVFITRKEAEEALKASKARKKGNCG